MLFHLVDARIVYLFLIHVFVKVTIHLLHLYLFLFSKVSNPSLVSLSLPMGNPFKVPGTPQHVKARQRESDEWEKNHWPHEIQPNIIVMVTPQARLLKVLQHGHVEHCRQSECDLVRNQLDHSVARVWRVENSFLHFGVRYSAHHHCKHWHREPDYDFVEEPLHIRLIRCKVDQRNTCEPAHYYLR
jgi:hypothetical protein